MATVDFQIGNKTYNIACDEGEQAKIRNLAESLNVRVDAISKTFSSASDNLIMVITALMMEDEIKSIKDSDSSNANLSLAGQSGESSQEVQQKIDEGVAEAMAPVVDFIENLANRVENS
jgi:cell division protein ZapA